MSFTRTNAGLSNLALFYSVDLIVFTEGGEQSFSFDEVNEGKFNKTSVDIKFWCSIFAKHNFNKTIEFRALGSKTSSRSICELIISHEINNVVVALDSDLDGFINNKFESPYILYTRGYSWENDVYHPKLVREQLDNLILSSELPSQYCEMIDEAYQSFDNYASRLLKLELMFRKGGSRLITDCHGERFIDGKSVPKIKMEQVYKLVKERKELLSRPIVMPEIEEICPIRYCYGKLRESLAIAVIVYIAKKLNGIKSLPKDFLVAAMIERYRNRVYHPEDEYYEVIINNLTIAST